MPRSDFERVYHAVYLIPSGKVATYGQVALWLDWPHGARTVGWALRALQFGTDVPWHRVVNAKGHISLADDRAQRALLEREGVCFDDSGRIDLTRYRWRGPRDSDWERD
jgi:methylated-DNA-protein-cysteine methyltransferase related protein